MKKKVATWHKNKTAPKHQALKKQPQTNPDKAHWIESRARLMKILEASGMKPEKCGMMLPKHRDR
jgi:hypothetical protein